MLQVVKTTNLVNKPTKLIGGMLMAVVFALLPISAAAQCSTRWDANGMFGIRQVGVLSMTFDMRQNGRVITGKAWGSVNNRSGGVDGLDGTIEGTLDGDNFNVTIYWKNGQTGIYNAKVNVSGRLDGHGHEKNSPNIRVPWHSEGGLKCAPAPPPVKPQAETRSSTVPQTPASPPAPPKPPFIIASHPVLPSPMHPLAIVGLSWDGGPDHPKAKVFVSINNGPEVPAFSTEHAAQSPVWKQPKNGIAMNLQRHFQYRFVLKSGGKTLSTAAFVVQ